MILADRIGKSYRTKAGKTWLFRDLSLAIPPGMNLAVLGASGSGKSTLLRIIGGIESPSEGRIQVRARVSWPLGAATGMQPHLSGRQNARFVARVYGPPDLVDAIVQEIWQFSELGPMFDEPLRSYTQPMKAQLAFATSMVFEFDVYLVDEMITAGTGAFRAKAQQAFRDLRGRAGIIMASRRLGLMRDICDSAIVLLDGRAHLFDDVGEAVRFYQDNHRPSPAAEPAEDPSPEESADG